MGSMLPKNAYRPLEPGEQYQPYVSAGTVLEEMEGAEEEVDSAAPKLDVPDERVELRREADGRHPRDLPLDGFGAGGERK